jgi:hypothetical protein
MDDNAKPSFVFTCSDAFKNVLDNVFGYGEQRKLRDAFMLYWRDENAKTQFCINTLANACHEMTLRNLWFRTQEGKQGKHPSALVHTNRIFTYSKHIREGQSQKKTPHFVLSFFANFQLFLRPFPKPSSRRNSTKPQDFSMNHYSAKQHSGIINYISQQSHVMHQLVLLNLVVIYVIIVVAHEAIYGQPRCQ